MAKIKAVLVQAAQMQQIMFDVTPYIVSVPSGNLQEVGGSTQYPAALLFLLNHFAKAIVSQLAQEVSRDTHAADPIGILAVTMFSAPDFLFNGHSLIDVLWAKYHKVCPVLFGIYGPEGSQAGRARLGWRIDDGAEVKPQDHYDQMTGFAAGFSAITLRDFTKSKNKSPAPVHLFWTALARIVSTPNNEQTPTHYVVLNNMLKHSVPRFIGFYGTAAIAALRTACIGFPSGGGPPGPSGSGSDSTVLAVQSLPHSWQRDLNLTL
jgi:nucleoporin GLE1